MNVLNYLLKEARNYSIKGNLRKRALSVLFGAAQLGGIDPEGLRTPEGGRHGRWNLRRRDYRMHQETRSVHRYFAWDCPSAFHGKSKGRPCNGRRVYENRRPRPFWRGKSGEGCTDFLYAEFHEPGWTFKQHAKAVLRSNKRKCSWEAEKGWKTRGVAGDWQALRGTAGMSKAHLFFFGLSVRHADRLCGNRKDRELQRGCRFHQ